ncbi:MAG: tRNA (adenosine(37)-N6)-threonylcarbamoyltransferase complex ATPase subunit type 1 TsaE [Cyanobacteria bacterium PR.023]|jgi:tRNA threonylcarbamoyl adenosine modification protein YjeE|nr:tRNA (adenosine(37)-N6)-threonylcarbamoyltransferase complex ATPase subunit type 1 TsaE [Cyanobacteria bacterium PR.023]MDQ5934035.1 tRNA threonylcarbamoyladenosine biosynthesis protein TsaE [Cyanobacteriota bacterium erpe_2018_sw_21hr_WHONDRS-SW48-000092_B_bin.40]
MTIQFHLGGLPQTKRFGLELAHAVGNGAIIALSGTLGAGKTTLVKAVGSGLGVTEVISSPTFTMLNEYHSGRLSLFHLDLYRAGETGETIDLSMLALELDEVLDEVHDATIGGLSRGLPAGVSAGLSNPPALVMIEWPQYFLVEGESYLSDKDYLEISLDLVKQGDLLCSVGGSQEGAVEKVLQETYEAENPIKDGVGEARIANLVGHGPESSQVIGRLQSALPDMVIYL